MEKKTETENKNTSPVFINPIIAAFLLGSSFASKVTGYDRTQSGSRGRPAFTAVTAASSLLLLPAVTAGTVIWWIVSTGGRRNAE